MLDPGRGTYVRLIPLGNGYRYVGEWWFDGRRQEATLNFGMRSSVQCTAAKAVRAPGAESQSRPIRLGYAFIASVAQSTTEGHAQAQPAYHAYVPNT